VDVAAVEAQVVLWLREARALTTTQFRQVKPALADLQPRLAALGFELGKTIRVRLATQIKENLHDGFLTHAELVKRIAGASKSELQGALTTLLRDAVIVAVVRPKSEGYMLSSQAAVATRQDLLTLQAALKATQVILRRGLAAKASHAKSVPSVVLQEDLPVALRHAQPVLTTAARQSDSSTLAEDLRRAIEASAVPLQIPSLLRRYGASAEWGKQWLLESARAGWCMLEPESGMGRLADFEKAYCIAGPHDSLLAWVSRSLNHRPTEL
jgi:hypothetical protein